METSLHQQLKTHYASKNGQVEVPLGRYRIDVVRGEQLIEIQHGSLSAIRDKVKNLLKNHCVTVIKPIVARKKIVKLDAKQGNITGSRFSPKKKTLLNLFDEFVYFTNVFPHPNLTLEVPLVEIEEIRYPGHGRRRRWRKNDFVVQDQRLVKVGKTKKFKAAKDLARLIPRKVGKTFHTGDVARTMDINRSDAQRMMYCLRKIDGVHTVGKQGNALLYKFGAA